MTKENSMSLKEQTDFSKAVIERKDFPSLLEALQSRSLDLLGPTIRDNAVVYDRISGAEDLPIGWIDRQNHGSYRLAKHKKKTLFGYVVGPHNWKKFLYPPERPVLEIRHEDKKIEFIKLPEDAPKQAFIGVRACEVHAIAIMDKILMQGPHADADYTRRRKNSFIVAVNCTRAGGNCFCVSMQTGPKAEAGFDLALTEVIEDDNHFFLAEAGSKAGEEVLRDIPHRKPEEDDLAAADKAIQHAASRMGRNLVTEELPEILQRNFDNPQWDDVGTRCLSCGNCTLVCPTCFCMTLEDRTDLTGQNLQRWRRWDSCHTVDFSYIHGGSVRNSTMARYRQWMMHKLSYWPEQFGTFGCVGCGRCITWCPVGIDLTAEAAAIRKSE